MLPTNPPGLRALLAARLLGAVVEHGWKMLAAFLALRALAASGSVSDAPAMNEAARALLVFLVPHTLVALPAGLLADRFGMRRLLVAGKVVELLVALAGVAVVATTATGSAAPLVVLGWFGVRSGLLGPATEGLLPELLPHRGLSDGNARLAAWSFAGIVVGTAAIGRPSPGGAIAAAGVLAALSALGLAAAWRVPDRERPASSLSPWGALCASSRELLSDRPLRLAVVGLALFWFTAGLLGHNVSAYARMALDLGATGRGLPLGALAIGVVAGAVLAGRWSRDQIEVGLAPLGGLALTALTALHALLSPGFLGALALFFLIGTSCGLLLVPLSAVVQWRATAERRGTVIGMVAALSGAAVVTGLVTGWWMLREGAGVRSILLTAASVAAVGAVWGTWLFPAALVRALIIVLTTSVYRLTVIGRENVPHRGGVLLTPNHVSFVDGWLVITAFDRPVRFLVHEAYFRHPLLAPFMRALGGIPVSSGRTQEQITEALSEAGAALDRGEVVCVFPEGQITRTGALQQFRRGIERIAAGRDAVIVPVFLDRVWGSLLSRAGGRFLFKLPVMFRTPKRLRYPITVEFGAPLPADTDANAVRDAVERLGAAAWRHRRPDAIPLGHSFVRTARRAPFRLLFATAERPRLSRIGALGRAIALARSTRDQWRRETRIGCLLEPGLCAALVQMATALAGKTFVPLDPGARDEGVANALRAAEIRTVVTSGAALARYGVTLPPDVAAIDLDRVPRAGAVATLLAWFAPRDVIERACGAERLVTIDDDAAIVFTSGRSGLRKGVRLTHFNLDANVEALAQALQPRGRERLALALPHWSAFGHVAVWLGATQGVSVVFVAEPHDADDVARAAERAVERTRATALFATPDQLATYVEKCKPTSFGSLHLIVTGAAPLPDALRDTCDDRFGVRPLEAYGATECAPIIAVGAPDFRARGFFQPGNRRGFVGRPLPGVAVQVVDPDSFEERPDGETGLILVRGQNVMRGYLGPPERTAAVMRGDWYVTGDLGAVDADGFVSVQGLLGACPSSSSGTSRFDDGQHPR